MGAVDDSYHIVLTHHKEETRAYSPDSISDLDMIDWVKFKCDPVSMASKN